MSFQGARGRTLALARLAVVTGTVAVALACCSNATWAGPVSPLPFAAGRAQVGGYGVQFAPQSAPTTRTSSTRRLALPILGAAAGVTLLVLRSALVVIKEGETALVERLGRFSRQLNPGLHVLVPVVDSVRERLTLREQVLDIPPQACITSDNAPLKADAVVYWKILDPAKSVYAVANLVPAIQNLLLTQLRSEIGRLTLDETFSARERLNSVLLKDVDLATDPWGVKITRVEVRDIIPNKDILQSMELQMAAERTKRAQIIKSEGQKLALLNEASGEAEARVIEAQSRKTAAILQAEAEKERLEREAEGLAAALKAIAAGTGGDQEKALRVQLLKAYIDAQAALAGSPNAKVMIFPSLQELRAQGSVILSELQASALGGPTGT